MRKVKTWVLPDPAVARTSSRRAGDMTASRCSGVSPTSRSWEKVASSIVPTTLLGAHHTDPGQRDQRQ